MDLRIESINPLRIEIEILDLVRAFAVLATPALRFGEFLFLEISEFLSYSQGLSGAKDNFRFFDQAGGKFLGGRGSRRAYQNGNCPIRLHSPCALARDFVSTRY